MCFRRMRTAPLPVPTYFSRGTIDRVIIRPVSQITYETCTALYKKGLRQVRISLLFPTFWQTNRVFHRYKKTTFGNDRREPLRADDLQLSSNLILNAVFFNL